MDDKKEFNRSEYARELIKKTKRCEHGIILDDKTSKKCNLIALKNFPYCHFHIKYHPIDYEKFLKDNNVDVAKQALVKPKKVISKYSFIKKDFPASYREISQSEDLTNLKPEISILSTTLNRLCAMNLNNIDNHRVIDTQLRLINQIRLLIKTMKDVESERNRITISFNDLKLFMLNTGQVIKNYVKDLNVQEKIGQEIYELYKKHADDNGNGHSKNLDEIINDVAVVEGADENTIGRPAPSEKREDIFPHPHTPGDISNEVPH